METKTANTDTAIYKKALALLARREHSASELSRKLMAKGFGKEPVASLVSRLCRKDLISDARFTENFVRQRIAAGYGPIRIRYELRERGVDDELITQYLPRDEKTWPVHIARVREKRFGTTKPTEYREQARQMRFLLHRGFEGEPIRKHFYASEE